MDSCQYLDAAPHPVFGRIRLQPRVDLRIPELPSVPDTELDYTFPPWPQLTSSRPYEVLTQCVAAATAAVAYYTKKPCVQYLNGMTRSESLCVASAARILRKVGCPPHAWAKWRLRVMQNLGDKPWIPDTGPAPKITEIFNPGSVKTSAEVAKKSTYLTPWLRSPAGYKLAELLETARDQSMVACRFENITQADLDRAAHAVRQEIERLRGEVRMWNNMRYSEDMAKIDQGVWIWS